MKSWQIVVLSIASLVVVTGLIYGVVSLSFDQPIITSLNNTTLVTNRSYNNVPDNTQPPTSNATVVPTNAAPKETDNASPDDEIPPELDFEQNSNEEVFDLTPSESELPPQSNTLGNTNTVPQPSPIQPTNTSSPSPDPLEADIDPSLVAGQWEITATLKNTKTGESRSMKIGSSEFAPNGSVSFSEDFLDDKTRFTAQYTGNYEVEGSTWKYRGSATGNGMSEVYGGPFALKFSAVVDGVLRDDRKEISGNWLMTEIYTSNQKTTVNYMEGPFRAVKK